jgi:sphingomyelin phosphodiesterase acid-like 3
MALRATMSILHTIRFVEFPVLAGKGVPLISIRKFPGVRITVWLWLLILVACPLASRSQTQPTSRGGQRQGSAGTAQTESRNFSALLVSDIHVDPFHDPEKVRQLVAAPASQWGAILSGPASPNQEAAFATLQQGCQTHGVDTPYTLLRSSLEAMRSRQPDAKFMTVSGDLIAHSLSCRYTTLFPESTPSDYQSFVLKTLSFVMGELRASIPGVPVYVALGNNDTACDDYRLDAGSEFLAQAGRIVAEGLAPSQRQQAIKVFAKGGYYSLTMAAPMRDTRLIVLNDLFLSPKYRTCAGKSDTTAATAEMAWLQGELAQARRLGQRVWVMGHIPPGIDPYSTVARMKDVCGSELPEMFLFSERLADLMMEYGDTIRLGIFAHTHMDELRLLEPEGSDPQPSPERSVALKLVASISPVDGNNPSFTIAQIDGSTALLRNYEVVAASNQTGIGTTWSSEYDYAQTYHEVQFSPSTVKKLIMEFEDDHGARTEASQQYIRNYYVGDRSAELKPFWPLYVCALANHTAKAYAACVCPAR